MLTFDLSLASAEEAGAAGSAVGSGVDRCRLRLHLGLRLDLRRLRLGFRRRGRARRRGVLPVVRRRSSTFGSGLGAGGADSSGFAASRGAGGGRGGPTTGGTAAGGILRAVAADFGLDFVETGASGESNGLMALGMRTFVGPL